MNKVDEAGRIIEITAADETKYLELRKLIGMCIDNTILMSRTKETSL
jgi:hypothetical protein